jgi:hypothetical protein
MNETLSIQLRPAEPQKDFPRMAELMINNDSENTPMLAVNRKLGYQPRPGKYLLLQKL